MYDPTGNEGPIASRFTQLASERQSFVHIARTCSALTLPTLFPQDAGSGSSLRKSNNRIFKTPWQSMGARGVNNLASKLLLALLPPNQPFFKFEMSDKVIDNLSRGEAKLKAEVETALARIERGITKEIESTAMRVPIFLALKHLIVTGNYLLYLPPQGGARGFRMDHFVVKRDPMGTLMELIVEESLDVQTVPPDIRKIAKARLNTDNDKDDDTPIQVYTRILRKDTKYVISQECAGVTVPKSAGSYPLDASPWLPLRWHKVDGEDYGRGHVEEYVGDLKSLEALSQAIVEGSATAARMIFLVKPGTSTKVKDLEALPNGGIGYGNAEDVTVVQSQKQADLRVAAETANKIQEQLAYAFMLNTAIQRPGERVTAEEIRFMAGELEDTLGGVYSIQSQELQLPLVRRVQLQMEKTGKIPTLPKESVKPSIVTGLEAIGRGQDLTRYQGFVTDLEVLAKVDPSIAQSLDGAVLMERMATARGIDVKDLIKSDEQMAEDQQAAQQAQMMQAATPEMMKAGGNIVTEAAKGMMANGGQGIQGIAAGAQQAGAAAGAANAAA